MSRTSSAACLPGRRCAPRWTSLWSACRYGLKKGRRPTRRASAAGSRARALRAPLTPPRPFFFAGCGRGCQSFRGGTTSRRRKCCRGTRREKVLPGRMPAAGDGAIAFAASDRCDWRNVSARFELRAILTGRPALRAILLCTLLACLVLSQLLTLSVRASPCLRRAIWAP